MKKFDCLSSHLFVHNRGLNWTAHTDMQRQVAALRRMSQAGSLKR